MCRLIERLREEWRGLDAAIAELDAAFRSIARQEEASRRLMTIPGFGPPAAIALRATTSPRRDDEKRTVSRRLFRPGTPQASTGGRTKLLGISKRGDRYLRTLLIQGARVALPHLAARDTPARLLAQRSSCALPSQRR